MISVEQTVSWLGLRVTDGSGDPIGKLEGVYVDRADGKPRWLSVATGRFGSRSVLVPVSGAASGNGIVMVDTSREAVLTAPRANLAHSPLAAADDRALARHYRHFGRLRELSAIHDHITSASPVTNPKAIARDERYSHAA